MDRPYIVCHMLTSLDGKITGPYMNDPGAEEASIAYEVTNESYKPDAFLNGRVTIDENFTFYRKPNLDKNAPKVPPGDYVARNNCEMYYVGIDASGRIGYEKNTIKYLERPEAHIIAVLSEKASNAYKAFLRKLEISYIISGKEHIDCELAMKKLKSLFHINVVMLSGGGYINYSFLQAGLIDELSILMAPVADGESNTVTLFERADYFKQKTFRFNLKDVTKLEGGTLWLKYTVSK